MNLNHKELASILGEEDLLDFTIARTFAGDAIPKDTIEKLLAVFLGKHEYVPNTVMDNIFKSKESAFVFMMALGCMLKSVHFPAYVTDKMILGMMGGVFAEFGKRFPEDMKELRKSFYKSVMERSEP